MSFRAHQHESKICSILPFYEGILQNMITPFHAVTTRLSIPVSSKR
jgi:hypothetical protein